MHLSDLLPCPTTQQPIGLVHWLLSHSTPFFYTPHLTLLAPDTHLIVGYAHSVAYCFWWLPPPPVAASSLLSLPNQEAGTLYDFIINQQLDSLYAGGMPFCLCLLSSKLVCQAYAP